MVIWHLRNKFLPKGLSTGSALSVISLIIMHKMWAFLASLLTPLQI